MLESATTVGEAWRRLVISGNRSKLGVFFVLFIVAATSLCLYQGRVATAVFLIVLGVIHVARIPFLIAATLGLWLRGRRGLVR